MVRKFDSRETEDAHEHARCGIVLKDDLVNDARAGLPELDAVLAGSALEEVEDFLVCHDRPLGTKYFKREQTSTWVLRAPASPSQRPHRLE